MATRKWTAGFVVIMCLKYYILPYRPAVRYEISLITDKNKCSGFVVIMCLKYYILPYRPAVRYEISPITDKNKCSGFVGVVGAYCITELRAGEKTIE